MLCLCRGCYLDYVASQVINTTNTPNHRYSFLMHVGVDEHMVSARYWLGWKHLRCVFCQRVESLLANYVILPVRSHLKESGYRNINCTFCDMCVVVCLNDSGLIDSE